MLLARRGTGQQGAHGRHGVGFELGTTGFPVRLVIPLFGPPFHRRPPWHSQGEASISRCFVLSGIHPPQGALHAVRVARSPACCRGTKVPRFHVGDCATRAARFCCLPPLRDSLVFLSERSCTVDRCELGAGLEPATLGFLADALPNELPNWSGIQGSNLSHGACRGSPMSNLRLA